MGKSGTEFDRYNRDLGRGTQYEDFASWALLYYAGMVFVPYRSKEWQNVVGENSGGVEIKFQDRMKDTGNLWIETYRKSHPGQADYRPSGILRNDNGRFMATGDYERIFLFSRVELRLLSPRYSEIENSTLTSRGFLMPISPDALKYAADVIVIKSEDRPDTMKLKDSTHAD